MGALTSKPFAFTARPWELVATPSIDVFDATLSGVRVDSRGLEVLRMLPLSTNTFAEDWVTDKLRYSYDGLKRARVAATFTRSATLAWLALFLKKDAVANIVSTSWEAVLSGLAKVLKNRDVSFLSSTTTDLASYSSVETLLYSLGSSRPVFPYSLDYSSQKALFDGYSSLLLFATNLRYELPLVNVGVLRRVSAGSLKVFSVGATGFNYSVGNLGMCVSSLVSKLAYGKHRLLKLSNSPLFCVTTQQALFNDFYLAENARIKLSTLSRNASASTQSAFSFGSSKSGTFLVSEDTCFVFKNVVASTWYHVSHGSSSIAQVADFVTPALTFTEQDSFYVDLFGSGKRASFVAAPIAKATTLGAAAQILLASAFSLSPRAIALPSVFELVLRDYSSLKEIKNSHLLGKCAVSSKLVRATTYVKSYADYLLDNSLLKSSRPLLLAASRFAGTRSNFL